MVAKIKVKTLKDLSSNASSLKLHGKLHQDFAILSKINKPPSITQEKVNSEKLRKKICNKLLLEYSEGKTLIQPTREKCSQELDDLPLRGWLLHSSDKDPKLWMAGSLGFVSTNLHNTGDGSYVERRHFWRLEDNLITLFLSESESLFYKQIPLSSVVKVKKHKNDQRFHLLLHGVQLTVSSDGKDRDRCKQVVNRWYNALMKAQREDKLPKKTAADKGSFSGHPVKQESKGIFHGIQFALNLEDSSFEAKKQLRELITSNGGQISYIITRNTKYLVVCQELTSGKSVSYKLRKALKLAIPVISENFVRGSVEQGKLQKIEFSGQKSNENFSRGKISAPVLPSKLEKVEKFDIKKIAKYNIDDGDCPNFPEEFHVAKYSILQITGKTTKFVCVEAQIATLGQNKDISRGYRVMVSSKVATEKVSRFVYSVASIFDLIKCYEALVRKFQAEGMTRSSGVSDPEFCDVVSEPLGMIMSEMKSSSGIIHPEVIRLIESVWIDSIGELKTDMGVDPENIKLDQIRNAMIVLLKIEEALKSEKYTQKLSDEFYKYITPRNAHDKTPIDSIKKVAKKRELCQLLKDIISTNENSWLSTKMSSSYSQYLALKCAFAWVDPQGNEFKTVKDMLPDQSSDLKFKIRNIYKVGKAAENFEFRQDLGNKKLLFHASAAINFVGIFSRGLLMPLSATSELGIERRDEGKLGSGVYFSDSFQASSEFATTSRSRGTRLMLVNEVALGDVHETKEEQPDLKSPPEGFHSVKGIGLTRKGCNEYAVYNTNQQRMRYVIEFTLNDEMAVGHDIIPMSVVFEDARKEGKEISETSENMEPPLKDIQYGLIIESKGASAKLEEVHIRAKVIDLVSEVTLFQSYINMAHDKVEAKYVFPLADNAAVCGFEAFINEKHVVGEVKEKEEAHREYKKAVAEGHGAYLMDEEKPNVFTVSVGNIPPRARVVIKITYIVELGTVDEPDSFVLFTLPGNIAKWNEDSTLMSSSITQSTTKSIAVSKGKKSSLMLSVDMPFDILDVVSPTHNIVSKKAATKVCVKLQKTEFLGDKDFRLLIKVSEIHVPRIWIETDENEKNGEQVAMVTFFPEFDFDASENSDCTILLDMSNSMAGTSASYSKYISRLLIDKLPEKSRFNVVTFGSNFEESFVGFEKASDDMKENAKNFISTAEPCRGGSDLLPVLNSVNLLLEHRESGHMHNIFLVSDGHLTDSERVLSLSSQISRKSFSQTRIFTMGIGNSINSHLLQSLSIITGGHHEHFSPSTKNTWKAQLQKQMSFAAQPALTDVHIDWCNYEDAESSKKIFLHVPEQVKCVFSGSRLTAYSFLPGCTKATLNAKIRGKEFSTVITAHGLSNVNGKTLHRLAAKAIFKEYESGRLAEDGYVDQVIRDQRKSQIISLSIKHSVVSKFTSFVAVEKRKENEDVSITSGPPVCELVEAAFEDVIPQIGWGFEGLSPEENIDELLKRSTQMQTSSILRARDLALEAKNLCDDLPEPDVIRRLQVSAALGRMNAAPQNFDAFKELETALTRNLSELNYDLLNTISRKEDSLTADAIQDLADAFWPDHCTVQLSSLPEKLRPFAVGLYVICFNRNEGRKFAKSADFVAKFWDEMHIIDMKGSDDVTGDVMVQLKNVVDNVKKRESRQHQLAADCFDTYDDVDDTYVDTYGDVEYTYGKVMPSLTVESESIRVSQLKKDSSVFGKQRSMMRRLAPLKKCKKSSRSSSQTEGLERYGCVKRSMPMEKNSRPVPLAKGADIFDTASLSPPSAFPTRKLAAHPCNQGAPLVSSAMSRFAMLSDQNEPLYCAPSPSSAQILQSRKFAAEVLEDTVSEPIKRPEARRKRLAIPHGANFMTSARSEGVTLGSSAGSLFGSSAQSPAGVIRSPSTGQQSVGGRDFSTFPGFGALREAAPLSFQNRGPETYSMDGMVEGFSFGSARHSASAHPLFLGDFALSGPPQRMPDSQTPAALQPTLAHLQSTPYDAFGAYAEKETLGAPPPGPQPPLPSWKRALFQNQSCRRSLSKAAPPPPPPPPASQSMLASGFDSFEAPMGVYQCQYIAKSYTQQCNAPPTLPARSGFAPPPPPPTLAQAVYPPPTRARGAPAPPPPPPPSSTATKLGLLGSSFRVRPTFNSKSLAFKSEPASSGPPIPMRVSADLATVGTSPPDSTLHTQPPQALFAQPRPLLRSTAASKLQLFSSKSEVKFSKCDIGASYGSSPSPEIKEKDVEFDKPAQHIEPSVPMQRSVISSNMDDYMQPPPMTGGGGLVEQLEVSDSLAMYEKAPKQLSDLDDDDDLYDDADRSSPSTDSDDSFNSSTSEEESESSFESESSVEEKKRATRAYTLCQPRWVPEVDALMKLLSLSEEEALEECSSRMEEEGFWRFPNDDQIEQHDMDETEIKMLKICKEIVILAGGRSLGLNCFAMALNMLLTAIMIQVLKQLWDDTDPIRVYKMFSLAEKWLKQADEAQPLLYSRLELGSSWEAAARSVVEKIAAKLCPSL